MKHQLTTLEQTAAKQRSLDSELIIKLKQENEHWKLKCKDEVAKANEKMLLLRNEIETKSTFNCIYKTQLEDAHEELKRLKKLLMLNLAPSSTSNTSSISATSTFIANTNKIHEPTTKIDKKTKKPPVLPRPLSGISLLKQYTTNNKSLPVGPEKQVLDENNKNDPATSTLLIDVDSNSEPLITSSVTDKLSTPSSLHSSTSSPNLYQQQYHQQYSPNYFLSNSKFFTNSNSSSSSTQNNLLNGTIRSNEERHSSRYNDNKDLFLDSSSSSSDQNNNNYNLNLYSVRQKAINLFNRLPLPLVGSSSSSNNNQNNHCKSNSSVNRMDDGDSTTSTSMAAGSSRQHPQIFDLIREICKKSRIIQVMQLVDRRHFYPTNEYYKAVATKRGAHSFTLAYEIKLLENIGK